MSEIMSLLFDEYTRNLFARKMEETKIAQARYQQLKELAGEEIAIEIWDTAVNEGAIMQEECFQAGLKTGIALAFDLLSQ
ncbi:MAG: hypothetical protein HFF42_06960 [Lawsonibacter sp.]|jgi:hypothetical protein|nr:hypothetical protein [Lawsonibacter sp.]